MNRFVIIIFIVQLYCPAWSQSGTHEELDRNDKLRYEVGDIFSGNDGEVCRCDNNKTRKFYSISRTVVLIQNLNKNSDSEYVDEADIKSGNEATFLFLDEHEGNARITIGTQLSEKKILNQTIDEVSFKLNY